MLSAPKIIVRDDQPFAAIRIELNRLDIPMLAPPLIGEVAAWLERRGIKPAGAPFFSYTGMGPGERLEMEVGFPTAEQVQADGRVIAGIIPRGRFATLRYTGPYVGLYEANMALGEWLAAQGESPGGGSAPGRYAAAHLEIYETDPATEPDPGRWITDVLFRLGD